MADFSAKIDQIWRNSKSFGGELFHLAEYPIWRNSGGIWFQPKKLHFLLNKLQEKQQNYLKKIFFPRNSNIFRKKWVPESSKYAIKIGHILFGGISSHLADFRAQFGGMSSSVSGSAERKHLTPQSDDEATKN